MTILKIIADEITSNDRMMSADRISSNDMIVRNDDILNLDMKEYDLCGLFDDICDLEAMDVMSDEELDKLRVFLTYVISKDSYIDGEDVYAIVFGNGKRILWH
jgi:hypothetical protein